MRVTADQLIDALGELVNDEEFIGNTDPCGYGAFMVLVEALRGNKGYMDLPNSVTVEIKE